MLPLGITTRLLRPVPVSRFINRGYSAKSHSRTRRAQVEPESQKTFPSEIEARVPKPSLKLSEKFRRTPSRYPAMMQEVSSWSTAIRLRRMMAKHKSVTGRAETEEVSNIVVDAPNHMLSPPVWNMLLSFMGKNKKMDLVWTLYNKMKKRGFEPTNRTYTTVLNGYAGIAHSRMGSDFTYTQPTDRTLSRATIVHNKAQEHMRVMLERSQSLQSSPNDDEGLVSTVPGVNFSAEDLASIKTPDPASELDVAPTNSYLKFLSRHGMWTPMQHTFLSMHKDGPLSPDTITYTTMFTTLYHIHRYMERAPGDKAKNLQIGPTARGIWDQLIRQYAKIKGDEGRKFDNELVSQYLRCLIRGRPEDQREAVSLVEHIWSLPALGSAIPASSSSHPSPHLPTPLVLNRPLLSPLSPGSATFDPLAPSRPLPKLTIDIRSATTLISSLHVAGLSVLATHYTTLVLSDPSLVKQFDTEFLKIAILALSVTGDVHAIIDIMDSYQPPSTGVNGWSRDTWRAAITAARWAGEYNAGLDILRRATQLPRRVGLISQDPSNVPVKIEPFRWVTPNEKTHDARGVLWIKPVKIEPDSQLMSILFKTALQKSHIEIRSVLEVFEHFGGGRRFFTLPKEDDSSSPQLLKDTEPQAEVLSSVMRKKVGDTVELARDVQKATEKLRSPEWDAVLDEAKAVVGKWRLAVKPPLKFEAKASNNPGRGWDQVRDDRVEDDGWEDVAEHRWGPRTSRNRMFDSVVGEEPGEWDESEGEKRGEIWGKKKSATRPKDLGDSWGSSRKSPLGKEQGEVKKGKVWGVSWDRKREENGGGESTRNWRRESASNWGRERGDDSYGTREARSHSRATDSSGSRDGFRRDREHRQDRSPQKKRSFGVSRG